MNPLRALLFFAAVIASTYGYCYDAQVAKDQYFDDSFVCDLVTQQLPYPSNELESDLYNLRDLDMQNFLDASASCVNETRFFSNTYTAAGDYAYRCVCPTKRKLIEAVYVNSDVCYVVFPQEQDVHYASCGGKCTFDYGTGVVNDARGYFCGYSGFVQREFAVWCPNTQPGRSGRVLRAARIGNPSQYQPYGTFKRVTFRLPTLCACKGYFCSNHAQPAGTVL